MGTSGLGVNKQWLLIADRECAKYKALSHAEDGQIPYY